MKNSPNYIVEWLIGGNSCYLIWHDGGADKDTYLTSMSIEQNLLSSKSLRGLHDLARAHGLDLNEKPAHIIDLDAAIEIVKDFEAGRKLEEKQCHLLLDVWNGLDDVSRSVNISLLPRGDKLYKKLFWGNNLPAVTPAGQKYSPRLTVGEMHNLSRHFCRARDTLRMVCSLVD